mgnify:CR=1 FL=1
MTKEEIEHEKLWTEGIVSAVMLSSKGIVSDFISNLEKVGYKIVKAESENERLKAEREWTIDFDGKLMAGIKIVDGELSIVGAMDGYGNGISISKIVIKPQSPKQSCPQCKTEYTKEELLTNEHCFKCGFEMKGF